MASSKPNRRDAIKAGAALAATTGLPLEAVAHVEADSATSSFVHAYTDQLSYAPGDEVNVHISSNVKQYLVQLVSQDNPKRISRPLSEGIEYPIPKDASSHGCHWPVGYKFSIPKDAPSGYHRIQFAFANEKMENQVAETFFVVRPKDPGKNARILLQLSTNTYNAYTNWGGYSLYAYHGRHKVQGRRVSFDRPLTSQYDRWEVHFVEWAKKNGYALDFCVNSDLEFRPEILKPYKLVLSVGHD